MSAIKKGNSESTDQINQRIQRKFDLVFSAAQIKKKSADVTQSGSLSMSMDEFSDSEDRKMSSESTKKEPAELPVIDLDFTIEDELQDVPAVPDIINQTNTGPILMEQNSSSDNGGMDFDLDFNSVDDAGPEKFSPPPVTPAADSTGGIDLGEFSADKTSDGFDVENFNSEFAESTQKTIVIDAASLAKVDIESFSLEDALDLSAERPEQTASGVTLPAMDHNFSADMMSTEEAKANIESTIKDIIAPKHIEATKEFDIGQLSEEDITPVDNFSLDNLTENELSFSEKVTSDSKMFANDSTGEFFVDPLADIPSAAAPAVPETKTVPVTAVRTEESSFSQPASQYEDLKTERMSDEDSVRFHATIRQMREEREELLAQIKQMKTDHKELEQDNLTLKAGLDEAKIEISILRKRHMVELEDMKYRLTLSEEKKAMAEEKARQAEMRREKLEQKVRIDYNQVKLREKELESKLEMLSMDIDSQVHSRDQKILELRRKIDALEFNMENASIKEQRSSEDKRKLEDKLNKIMRTLRNSIKNLEEDIDLVQEEVPNTEKN